MSDDPKVLKALQHKTDVREGCELKYFALVRFRIVKRSTLLSVMRGKQNTAFMAVGKKGVFFVRVNMKKLCHGGLLTYEHFEKVLEDTDSREHFMLQLGSTRPPECPWQIFVESENRATLIHHIAVCFVTDAMLRLGQLLPFPKYNASLQEGAAPACVLPFQDHRHIQFGDYGLFLHSKYKDVPNAVAQSSTGEYKSSDDVTVSLHIYDPVPLAHLDALGREHIRWIALEYKQALTLHHKTMTLRNNMYLKKMNLSNDAAAWLCWEILLKAPDYTSMVVLLRRQYVPPMMDTVQDIAITFRRPTSSKSEKQNEAHGDEFNHATMELMREAHLAADTMGPRAQSMKLYPDIIQAKLDALLFDEDAYAWIRSRLKLRPDGEAHIERYAHIFLKGILRIFRDENALAHPELWEELDQKVLLLCRNAPAQYDLDPLYVCMQELEVPVEGLKPIPKAKKGAPEETERAMQINAWKSRVSRYLAWCVDGGLLGAKFTMHDIVQHMPSISKLAEQKLNKILAFLLHVRPKDLSEPWDPMQSIVYALTGMSAVECTFNDRVMQVLLELGYVQRLYDPKAAARGLMSKDCADVMLQLLQSDGASINLKSSICRQIIASKDAQQGPILCPGLLTLMRSGGLFLATYASAALVNLSQAKESVKNQLMKSGIADICLKQLKSKDDDLILYTLMLLVHLTKLVHHREIFLQVGIVPVIHEMLNNCYKETHVKKRILTELCSVIGQMCNDDDTRARFSEERHEICKVLLELLDNANLIHKDPWKLKSKILFAMKQLCVGSSDMKMKFGKSKDPDLIGSVITDLKEWENLQYTDWATNAIILLVVLAINNELLRDFVDHGWGEAHKELTKSKLGEMDATRDRIAQIQARIEAHQEEHTQNMHVA